MRLGIDESTGSDLRRLLENAVGKAHFKTSRGKLKSTHLRRLHERKALIASLAGAGTLVIEEGVLNTVVRGITPLLARYRNETNGRIGNAFALIMIGSMRDLYVDAEYLARRLITAGAKLGPDRASSLFEGWCNGTPLQEEEHAEIVGVTAQKTIAGSRITIRGQKREDPTADMQMKDLFQQEEIVTASRIVDVCQAFYKPPDALDMDETKAIQDGAKKVGLQERTTDFWERICAALALATKSYVMWRYVWNPKEELNAFGTVGHSATGQAKNPIRVVLDPTGINESTLRKAEAVAEALGERRHVGTGARRWNAALGDGGADSLIDLRIALESLYSGRKGGRTSAKELALRAAWHLGRDKRDRHRIYHEARRVYQCGSKVVHGEELGNVQAAETYSIGKELCRNAILMMLENEPKDLLALTLDGIGGGTKLPGDSRGTKGERD